MPPAEYIGIKYPVFKENHQRGPIISRGHFVAIILPTPYSLCKMTTMVREDSKRNVVISWQGVLGSGSFLPLSL